MIYASIPNTNDKVEFAVLNYHREVLGGRERSKDWQFANLSVRQDAKIYLFFFLRKIERFCVNWSDDIVINSLRGRRKRKTSKQMIVTSP